MSAVDPIATTGSFCLAAAAIELTGGGGAFLAGNFFLARSDAGPVQRVTTRFVGDQDRRTTPLPGAAPGTRSIGQSAFSTAAFGSR